MANCAALERARQPAPFCRERLVDSTDVVDVPKSREGFGVLALTLVISTHISDIVCMGNSGRLLPNCALVTILDTHATEITIVLLQGTAVEADCERTINDGSRWSKLARNRELTAIVFAKTDFVRSRIPIAWRI